MSDFAESDELMPQLLPLDAGWLDVGDGHRIYHARSGNPEGVPVLLLHGGPASGSSPHHVRFFNPERYHIFQFDQRGSGQSTPLGERDNNTTDRLVADIERLRQEMGVQRWLVMGGSWGSALALLYAARHPDACSGLMLRGVFLADDADMQWYFHEMRHFLPRDWAVFADAVSASSSMTHLADRFADGTSGKVPGDVLGDVPGDVSGNVYGDVSSHGTAVRNTEAEMTAHRLINAYRDQLEDVESAEARNATAAYMRWEQALGSALAPTELDTPEERVFEVTLDRVLKYRLQLHYMVHGCFVESGEVLDSAVRLSTHELPVAIVHGRRDCICRPVNAWRVFQAFKGSRLQLIDNTGHDPFSRQMVSSTMTALRCFATNGNFDAWSSEDRS